MPAGHRPSSRAAPELPRLVLFDLDDTLFDHSLTCRSALRELRRERVIFRNRTVDELWQEYARLLAITHPAAMFGRRTTDQVRTDRFSLLAAWCGHPVDRGAAFELSAAYRVWYQRLRRPVPGAPEFVRRVRGRSQIGIVTNHTVVDQAEKLVFLGLDDTVDFLVTSEEIGAAKPEPSIFHAALRRASVGAADAVMVGDGWDADIVGAQRTGIRAVWFNRFGLPRPPTVPVAEFASFRPPGPLERLMAVPSAR